MGNQLVTDSEVKPNEILGSSLEDLAGHITGIWRDMYSASDNTIAAVHLLDSTLQSGKHSRRTRKTLEQCKMHLNAVMELQKRMAALAGPIVQLAGPLAK